MEMDNNTNWSQVDRQWPKQQLQQLASLNLQNPNDVARLNSILRQRANDGPYNAIGAYRALPEHGGSNAPRTHGRTSSTTAQQGRS